MVELRIVHVIKAKDTKKNLIIRGREKICYIPFPVWIKVPNDIAVRLLALSQVNLWNCFNLWPVFLVFFSFPETFFFVFLGLFFCEELVFTGFFCTFFFNFDVRLPEKNCINMLSIEYFSHSCQFNVSF